MIPPSLTGLVVAVSALALPLRAQAPVVARANDNRAPAGALRGDTLFVDLEVRTGRWYPDAADGPFIDAPMVAERGQPPQVPSPLLRVRTGTTIVATVTNALADSTITMFGLQRHDGAAPRDSLTLRPGERRAIHFAAGEAGTYVYHTQVGRLDHDSREREQLSGAFVVDAPGARTDDRIFVINIWGERVDSTRYRNALAINGKSWPHTERLTYAEGDSVRWRVVNGSARPHPMHLHGFFFQVRSKGRFLADSIYGPDQRRLAVTEILEGGQSMTMAWKAERPGNWLFHCHLIYHALAESRLSAVGSHGHDATEHMGGLVTGIQVTPTAPVTLARTTPRRLRLWVQEGKRRGRAPQSFGYVVERDGRAPAVDSVEIPGSPLILTRGQATDVMVHNRLRVPTSVHWHGLELESPSDGVVGWSGHGANVARAIAPGDSFVARLTTPRAGTFIYHTHLSDVEQLTGGLYGALIVLHPRERFDAKRDHPLVIGWDGPDEPPQLLVNGDSTPPPLQLSANERHRLRFVCIGAVDCGTWSLYRDSTLQHWSPLAKDGADLPASQLGERSAAATLWAGETLDVEVALQPGEYALVAGPLRKPNRVVRVVVPRR